MLLALRCWSSIVLMSGMVERSRFGMSLLAIKQNEPAAEAAGIDTLRWKMQAIMLSGAIAAPPGPSMPWSCWWSRRKPCSAC